MSAGTDVTRRMPSNLFPALDSVTAEALFGDLGWSAPGPRRGNWGEAFEQLVEQRLSGLALAAIRRGRLPVDDAVRRRLRATAFEAASRSERVLQRSGEGLGRLEKLKIDFVVTKGPGLSRLDGGPQSRPFDDLDVIVEPRSFARALGALEAIGYEEQASSRPPRAAFTKWCREGINLRHPAGGSIDLHHTVAPWLWGSGIRFAALLARSTRDQRTGLPLVSVEHNLLVAALHLVSDRGRPGKTLRAWRDVVLTARASSVPAVLVEAEDADLVGWLRWVLACLPGPLKPLALVGALEDRGGDSLPGAGRIPHHRRLHYLLPPHLGSRHLVGQALRLPVPNALLFLAGMALPSPAFLARKYPGGSQPMLTWWKDCARGVARSD